MKNYALRLIAAEKNKVEEQFFSTKEEALKEYAKLREDNSGAHSLVALLDCKNNTVLHLLQFEAGQLRIDLADGDVVRLREGYYEKGEEKYLYKVSDINENTGRCLILCINSGAAIPAAESVDVRMVEVDEGTSKESL
ncbi:hypothetical protein [Phascolarctobacterium succinatutens]|uniref:hypothetical protein n=1 Tax=Phascolarctobacterium succinatutens TaxID=626940 RepID=UPI0023F2F268|nr:hypothetical protein [Phascolarctobacterium succinatutens]